MFDIKKCSFLRRMNKLDSGSLGAIDGCIPFLCECVGVKNVLSVFDERNDYKYEWKSLSMSKAERVKVAVVMYVKSVSMDDYTYAVASFINNMNSIGNNISFRAHINGVLIQSVLFLKDKYRTTNGETNSLNVSDNYEIPGRGKINDIDLVGSFNISNCYYYHLLEG